MNINRNKIIKIVSILIISFSIALFTVTGQVKPSAKLKFMSMNTEVEIIIYDRFFGDIDNANLEVSQLFKKLDSLWNPYDSLSEISAINRNAGIGKPIKVDSYTFDLVKTAVNFHNNVSPKFNIAVGPLIKLWKKAAKDNKKPCSCMVKRVKNQLLDNSKIILDSVNQTIFLKNLKMSLDFGAIAKGYAQKQVKKIMQKNRIKFYIVNSGGDMYVSSKYYRSFDIGITNPFQKKRISKVIFAKNIGVATSGDYERYYLVEGQRYSHIINPLTGYPQERFNSSTVKHKDPLMADIWATTLSIDYDSLLMSKFPKDKGGFILIDADTVVSSF